MLGYQDYTLLFRGMHRLFVIPSHHGISKPNTECSLKGANALITTPQHAAERIAGG